MPNYDLITILGPTASGKTPFAAALAYELNTEIISADSRQIYRGMDLGTGKDLADYTVNGHKIPYHLIDIAAPGYKYNVFEYQQDFLVSYETVKQKGCLPVLCGGTGMYLESVLKGYKLMPVPENPELRTRLASYSLEELTEILSQYKTLHNSTDVDTVKRAGTEGALSFYHYAFHCSLARSTGRFDENGYGDAGCHEVCQTSDEYGERENQRVAESPGRGEKVEVDYRIKNLKIIA